ncbi:MAG: PQQ-dependent sugar dehydrogenase [Pyrinomonadaceae bacterium]
MFKTPLQYLKFGIISLCLLSFFCGLVDAQMFRGANIAFSNKSFAMPPPAIQLQSVVSGLSNPLYVTNAKDSRLFIVEQTGQIKIYQSGALLPTPFLNISSFVNCCGERGLLGLAFHPQYPTTPYIFVHFTSNGTALPDGTIPVSGNNVIVRFTVSSNPNVVDSSSGKTLLVIPQPFSNHNGGTIEFGNDGYLYIGKGDGGSGNDPGNRAQNINELLGKILRLDVDQNVNTPPYYGIPATNPFVGTAGADEIFLLGLRNPFRFSFDRTTGDLWIGDVGQSAREEIDRLPGGGTPGGNLGWRIYEGTLCTAIDPCALPANYIAPVGEYSHTAGRCSITGGYVYRGTQIPSLVGNYVFADYCTGEIFRLNGTAPELLLDSPHNISSFGEDSAGELYITALSGQVLKIQAVPTAASVTISGRIATANGRGVSGAFIPFDGSGNSEPKTTRTNPFGFYRFSDVEVGQNYVITPSAKNYNFTPSSMVFTVFEDFTNLDFTAIKASNPKNGQQIIKSSDAHKK